MDANRFRPVVRVVTLVVATLALSLAGGAPSWTESVRISDEVPVGQAAP